MSGSIPSSASLGEWGFFIPFINTRKMPSSIQHLNNFEKNLDDMLVTIQLGAGFWIQRKKEYIHFEGF